MYSKLTPDDLAEKLMNDHLENESKPTGLDLAVLADPMIVTTVKFNTEYFNCGSAYHIVRNDNKYPGTFDALLSDVTENTLTFIKKGTHINIKNDTEIVEIDIDDYLYSGNWSISPLTKDDTEGDNDNLLIVETDNTGTDIVSVTKATLDLSKDVEISITEPEPDMKKFYIDDWDKIIDPDSSMKKYPLFVRDKHSSDRWIINYDVLCKVLDRNDSKNFILDITFKMKNCRAQACCSCKADDVEVHVGSTVLTGRRPGKKDACVHDAAIEFKACDWKEMAFAHVNLRRK